MANDTFCLTFLFLSKMGFLSHNFGSRYASKPINNSKDTDYSLVYKKMLCWIGAQRQVHLAKKVKACPHCDGTHKESQI